VQKSHEDRLRREQDSEHQRLARNERFRLHGYRWAVVTPDGRVLTSDEADDEIDAIEWGACDDPDF
jgi:hypothetical protein